VLPERVIRGTPPRVESNLWTLVESAGVALPKGPLAVPLEAWKARREELIARAEPTGLWLKPDDDPESIRGDLHRLPFVGVQFPKWGDGRGYSTGVVLRRLGYRGELRAFGDIGRDHLLFLKRCGFDAYSLGAQRDPEAALGAFAEFSVHYQGSVIDPDPLFRRRSAA